MMAGISTSREGRGNDSRYLKTGKLVFASRIFRRVRKIKKKKKPWNFHIHRNPIREWKHSGF